MGEHRLLCGDATSPAHVEQLLGDRNPFLMVTDPPYGVSYNAKWREDYDNFERHAVGLVTNDDRADWTEAWKLFPGDVGYIWHASLHTSEVMDSLVRAGFEHRAQIIWRKQHSVFSRGAYHWQHEPCWYVVRVGKRSNWLGDRKQTTIWDVANLNPMGGNTDDEESTGHGTQKPVEIMRRPILNHTDPTEAVYDPFLGSGTTVIAAESIGRICYGLELEPKYCDVIVQRWQKFTGREATLDGHGATFEHVRDGRMLEWQDAIKEEVLT